jgi:hypothetical protein
MAAEPGLILTVNSHSRGLVLARLDREGKQQGQRAQFFGLVASPRK